MRNSILFVAAVATATPLIAHAAPPATPTITRVMVVADTSDESSDLLTVAVAGTPLQRPVHLVLLGVLAVCVLAMGLYPRPFTDVMHVSVVDLLAHVAQSKLP